MLEGASFTGFVYLWMLLVPRVFFKEIWGVDNSGKDK